MSKHTPGPWHVFQDRNGWNVAIEHKTLTVQVSEPDARLIAAAPDMLVALKAIEEQLKVVYPQASCLSYVRAAIAKAEGRS